MVKGNDEMRPDNLGVIIEMRGQGDFPFLMMWEVWDGAGRSERVKEIINKLHIHGRPIVVRKYNSKTKFEIYSCSEKDQQEVIKRLSFGLRVDEQILKGEANA